MAISGTKITKGSFNTSWGMEYQAPITSTQDKKYYLYICDPVWYLVVNASYAALGRSGIVQVQPAYWNGSQWVEYSRVEVSGVNGNTAAYFCHNRTERDGEHTYHNDYPLWRIAYWPSRSNDRWSFTAYAGGWGLCNIDQYYLNAIGKKIRSRGRTGSGTLMHSTDQEENVYNTVFNYMNRKGSPISASDDAELVWYPYLEN